MNVTVTDEVLLHEEKLVLNEDPIAENGLWFAPECADCFLCKKIITVEENLCGHSWMNVCLNNTGDYIVFQSMCYHRGYYNESMKKVLITAQLFLTPSKMLKYYIYHAHPHV